jgi:uncharacterized protein YyaL (SSP411 family)
MQPSKANRLSTESSPYLLQHQHNPVDWYPWGLEAIETARRLNKPIFLSVGYSTCYWCHVMERQCFENEAIAKVMNELFVNIKVDREERPDVDNLYMQAVQILTQHGGWPMSVFLMPDLRPFYGGTYFPPEDAHGRPGFPSLLRMVEDAYRNRKEDVEKSASQLIGLLQQLAQPPVPKQPIRIDEKFIDEQIRNSTLDYDAIHGGFGGAPKFPRETLLELMLVHQQSSPNEQRRKMLCHTLDAMANGGIRDQLGGGFHRYSTDREWLVPHFEIMLYDNAMLAWVYVEAFRQFGNERYAKVARGILDFTLREMTSPEGAFYTAFDAEVDAQEGLNYLWMREEVESILGEGHPLLKLYGIDRGPNFADPHHGSGVPDKNILYLPDGSEGEDDPRIVEARAKLLEVRNRRKKPLLDTKILTSWNALMLRALAYAGNVLKEPRYLHAAAAAADYLSQVHRLSPSPGTPGEGRGEGSPAYSAPADRGGALAPTLSHEYVGEGVLRSPSPCIQGEGGGEGLARTSRDGSAKLHAFLDDYAFLAQALLVLAEATGDLTWRDRASQIAGQVKSRFGDPNAGGFYFTDLSSVDLPVRQKIASDSPLPSGNAIAVDIFLKLHDRDTARGILAAFAQNLSQQGEAMSSMLTSALLFVKDAGPFTVSSAQSPQRHDVAPNVVGIEAKWIDGKTLSLDMHILDGFHLNGNPATPGYIATELFLHDEMHTTIEYPSPTTNRFPFATEALSVYEGRVQFIVRFAQPVVGKGVIPMVLRYQACDDSSCLPPVSKKFEVSGTGVPHVR